MSKSVNLAFAGALSVAFLSACGGGGSDTPAATVAAQVVTSFPFQSGYKASIAIGSSDNFTVSGTCSGSAVISSSAPSAATFEGASALSVTTTITANFTNCTPASTASTSVDYYDSNYNLLGHSASGVEYGKFLTVPSPLPTAVKVGDTAIYGTETVYTDSTKQTMTEQNILSYVMEADGASTSTAIANAITKTFNTANQLLSTQQSRYRIAADGKQSIVSFDVQDSTTSSIHLLFTAK